RQQRFVVVRQTEEITLFRYAIERRVVNQARRRFAFVFWFLILVFGFVLSTRGAEPAFVMTFVDRIVAARRFGFGDSPPELADALVMERLGRAHEDVVTAVGGVETKLARHLFVVTDDVVRLLLRRAAGFRCSALDVDAVFVSAG